MMKNEEEVIAVLKRPATIQGSEGSLQEKKRLLKKENGVKSSNEYLQWLQEYKEEGKNEEEKKMDLVTSESLKLLEKISLRFDETDSKWIRISRI